MNKHPIEQTILDALDGSLSQQELTSLENELHKNPEALQLYIEYSNLENHLKIENEISQFSLAQPVIPIDTILKRQKIKSFRKAALATAAVVTLGLIAMAFFMVDNSPPTVAFETSPGTQYILTHDSDSENTEGLTMQKGSSLSLSQGAVELTFDSGVKSIITAPAQLTYLGENVLELKQGTAWFEVPDGAEGFTVKTEDLTIVDLGTEFGVLAKPNNHDQVHVIKGEVEVTSKRAASETLLLKARNACTVKPVGTLKTIAYKSDPFLTKLPDSLPYLHWSFDKKDQLQVSGTHPVAANIKASLTSPKSPAIYKQGKMEECLSLHNQGILTDWTGFNNNQPRTVCFWIRLPNEANYVTPPGIVSWGEPIRKNSKWKIMIIQDDENSAPYVRLSWGVTWMNCSTKLQRNKWYHITVTTTGLSAPEGNLPTAEIYINGEAEPTSYKGEQRPMKTPQMNTITNSKNASSLRIGAYLEKEPKLNQDNFKFDIDDLYIFEGSVKPEEAKALMDF